MPAVQGMSILSYIMHTSLYELFPNMEQRDYKYLFNFFVWSLKDYQTIYSEINKHLLI